MRAEAFTLGERRGDAAKAVGGGARNLDQAGALLEVIDPQG